MKITFLDRTSLGEDTPIENLSSLGEIAVYGETPPELVLERINDSDVVVINKIKMTDDVISNTKNLKLICVFATGFDNVDLISARKNNVGVCNVPGYSTDSVTLFTIATALALISHIFEYNLFVKNGEYTKSGIANKLTPVFHEISGKTWGIVGCGNIGMAVAKVASAFGARVIVYKRKPITDYECVDIDTLCKESDIISVHCPLNNETRGIINKARISLMKKDVVIVNEARGAVLVESDIKDAILNGDIGAFGCDVYSEEPFSPSHPYNEIKELPNVLLTPHAAWGAYEARARCIKIIGENISSFFNGGVKNRVDLL